LEGDRFIARPLPTQESTTQKNAVSWISSHDLNFRAVHDHTCLRQRGHWDRHNICWRVQNKEASNCGIFSILLLLSPSFFIDSPPSQAPPSCV